MAIAKRPHRPISDIQKPDSDREAERFIAGAGKQKQAEKPRKIMITHRCDHELLERIDAAAQKRGISRAAWINFHLSKALEEEHS